MISFVLPSRLLPTLTSVSAWAESILPAVKGGLGIRCGVGLSLPSFLSTLHSSSNLVSSIFSTSGISVGSSFLHEALYQRPAEYPMPPEDC